VRPCEPAGAIRGTSPLRPGIYMGDVHGIIDLPLHGRDPTHKNKKNTPCPPSKWANAGLGMDGRNELVLFAPNRLPRRPSQMKRKC